MSDYDEEEFKDKIEGVLGQWFGEEAVFREVYFPETYRFADFVVKQPLVTLAIEVKDGSEEVYKAAGQAIMYAEHYRYGIPVVILPHGELEQPEVDMISTRVQVVPMEPPE